MLLISFLLSCDALDISNTMKLKTGMPVDKIIQIMGDPDSVEQERLSNGAVKELWHYRLLSINYEKVSLIIVCNKLKLKFIGLHKKKIRLLYGSIKNNSCAK